MDVPAVYNRQSKTLYHLIDFAETSFSKNVGGIETVCCEGEVFKANVREFQILIPRLMISVEVS